MIKLPSITPNRHIAICLSLGTFPVLYLFNLMCWVIFGSPAFSSELSFLRCFIGFILAVCTGGPLAGYLYWYHFEREKDE